MHAPLSGPLMCCPWAPLITCGRGRAAGCKRAMEAWGTQGWSKGNWFTGAECDVVKWDQAAYLTHAPSQSSSQSPTHLFTLSVTHLLTYKSPTYPLCHNTNKQINKVISGNSSQDKKKNTGRLCLLQVLCFVIPWCGAACWIWSLWTSLVRKLSISLAIRLVGWCGCSALVCTFTLPAPLHLSTHFKWE